MRRLTILLSLPLCAASPLAAQACTDPCGGGPETVLVNAGLGGLTGGALAALRGGSFTRGFAQGAAGGGLTFIGKSIAGQRWEGAGLIGRQVAAVGTSVSWNAAERRAPFERLMLPVGPVRLYVTPGEGAVRPRLDAAGAIAAVDFALRSGSRLDWDASFADGTLVFQRPPEQGQLRGWHRAGITGYRLPGEGYPRSEIAVARAHERVHAIQYDQSFLLWSHPFEAETIGRTDEGRALLSWTDLGLNVVMAAVAGAVVPYEDRPWEREAYRLAPRTVDDGGPIQQD